MNANNHTTIMDLIGKYLSGEANAAEAMQLDDWLADPVNAREFKRIEALWRQLPGQQTPQPPAVQQVWAELESHLPAGRKPGIVRLLFNRYAAASVAGLLIIGALIWFTRDKNATAPPHPAAAGITQITNSEIKTATLPDSSTIIINQHSKVAYATSFSQPDRLVTMQGECFFDVMPDKMHPFIITIADLTIKVVGTSFNVREITSTGVIEVQVQSGVVQLCTAQQEITVHKGQTGIYNKARQELYVQDTIDINSMGYATKNFSFNDLALPEACRYLEKAFHVSIKTDTQKLAGCRLTARFDNKPLPYILDVINATLNTTSHREGDTIIIDGNGCH